MKSNFSLVFMALVSLANAVVAKRNSPIQNRINTRTLSLNIQNDWDTFKDLLNPIAVKRVAGTQEIAYVRNYISNQMRSFGWQVDFDSFTDTTPYGIKAFSNIIATLPVGTVFRNNKKPTQRQIHTTNRVIFACHYDSKYFANMDFVGAIDSAVPCAMLLDMAKFFKENFDSNQFNQLTRSIQFIFFDGEEAFKDWSHDDSLYGSRHLADTLYANYSSEAFDKIDLFVLLDLIGAEQMRFLNHFPQTSHVYNMLSKIETNLAQKKALTRTSAYFPDTNGYNGIYSQIDDDHRPFLEYNVPVLHMISVPFPSQWHTKDDTVANLSKNKINDIRLIMKHFLLQILNSKTNEEKLHDKEDL